MIHLEWFEQTGNDLASAVCALVKSAEFASKSREAEYLECVRRYEMRNVMGLSASTFATTAGESESKFAYPIERSIVNAAVADITRIKLKPRFITSGADWHVQRKAVRLQRLVVGQMAAPCGQYHDAYECVDAAFRDAAICGVGYVLVQADHERVCIERLLPWRVFTDVIDSEDGNPTTYMRVAYVAKTALKRKYPEHAAAIELAERHATGYFEAARAESRVPVYEVWRPGEDEDGRHVIALDGGTLLLDEECCSLPLVPIRWSPQVMGDGGTGLVYETWQVCELMHHVGERIAEGYRLRAGRRTYYQAGSLDPSRLVGNESEEFVEIQPGAQPPIVEMVPPLQAGELEFYTTLRQLAHDGAGVSLTSASGVKPPGAQSGRAIMAAKDVGSARLVQQAVARENAFKRVFRLIVDTIAEIAEENPDFFVSWPGESFLRTISWKDAELEHDQYVVEIADESAAATDVVGRMGIIAEGLSSGLITKEAYTSMSRGTLDIDKNADTFAAEREYIEDLIDRYLDAREGDEIVFDAPEGFLLDKQGAMTAFILAYFDASRKGAPLLNLELLRRYITLLGDMIARAQASQMAPPGAPPQSVGPSAPI